MSVPTDRRTLARLAPVAWALASALALALAPDPTPAQRATFDEVLDVQLVNVDVVVLDKNGEPVGDLAREDFQITDDGKKVEVGYFAPFGAAPTTSSGRREDGEEVDPGRGVPSAGPAAGADPSHLVIFVDLDNHEPHGRNRVLGELATGLSEAGDRLRVMVATFGPQGLDVELPFSASPAEWSATLEQVIRMPGRGAPRQAQQQRLVESIDRVLALADSADTEELAVQRMEELIGSVRVESESIRANAASAIHALQTLASVLSVVPGQKSLLYVGDGVPMRPGQDLRDLLVEVFESDRRFDTPGSSAAEATSGLRTEGLSFDLDRELQALTATANSQRVTLYALSTDAPGGTVRADFNVGARVSGGVMQIYDATRALQLEASLQRMADDTGGLVLPANARVGGFLGRVLDDRAHGYSLAYPSPHGGDGRYHQIKVKVSRKGVRLRHREGYVDRPPQVRTADLLAGALVLGSGDNPHSLEVDLVSAEPAANGEVKLTLRLRIPIDRLRLENAGDHHQTELELLLLSMDGTGSLAPMRTVTVTVKVPSARMAEAAGKLYGVSVPLSVKEVPEAVAVGVVEAAAQRTSVIRKVLVDDNDA